MNPATFTLSPSNCELYLFVPHESNKFRQLPCLYCARVVLIRAIQATDFNLTHAISLRLPGNKKMVISL